jgi:D-mannonate dehydratase
LEREAAALACWDSHYAPAKELLDEIQREKSAIESGELTWDVVAQGPVHSRV